MKTNPPIRLQNQLKLKSKKSVFSYPFRSNSTNRNESSSPQLINPCTITLQIDDKSANSMTKIQSSTPRHLSAANNSIKSASSFQWHANNVDIKHPLHPQNNEASKPQEKTVQPQSTYQKTVGQLISGKKKGKKAPMAVYEGPSTVPPSEQRGKTAAAAPSKKETNGALPTEDDETQELPEQKRRSGYHPPKPKNQPSYQGRRNTPASSDQIYKSAAPKMMTNNTTKSKHDCAARKFNKPLISQQEKKKNLYTVEETGEPGPVKTNENNEPVIQKSKTNNELVPKKTNNDSKPIVSKAYFNNVQTMDNNSDEELTELDISARSDRSHKTNISSTSPTSLTW